MRRGASPLARLVLAFGAALLAWPASGAAQDAAAADTAGEGTCIALVLPSVKGVDGDATSFAASVRELFASYLTGPGLRTIELEARLPAMAVQEAREKDCPNVLLTTLTRKRGGSGFARALGSAAGAAAWHVPYAGTAAGAAARGAAIAGAHAVSTMAANTREKDELKLEYRVGALEQAPRSTPKSDKAKAKSDGEDLLTPMVERAAESIVATVMK